MYFPYLYGKRFELLAVRNLLKDFGKLEKVIPIIEPVKLTSGDLANFIEALGKKKATAIVVVNPHKDEFKNGDRKPWQKVVNAALAKFPTLIPGLYCGPDLSVAQADSFVTGHPGRDVALLYAGTKLTDVEIQELVKAKNVRFHVNLRERLTTQQKAKIPKSKRVDVKDNFNKQERNADYGVPEVFSDHHKTYTASCVGFGDYTITGAAYEPGGGKPAAVAIHTTYKQDTTNDIWVEHFVSDDTDINVGDTPGKYVQAVKKLAKAARTRKSEFGTNCALDGYADDARNSYFPGLGKNKERQIYHHIALLHRVLSGAI